MTDLNFIQHLSVLRLQPGDTLVVRMPEMEMGPQEFKAIADQFKLILNLAGVRFEVPVLCLTEGQELAILRAGADTERKLEARAPRPTGPFQAAIKEMVEGAALRGDQEPPSVCGQVDRLWEAVVAELKQAPETDAA